MVFSITTNPVIFLHPRKQNGGLNTLIYLANSAALVQPVELDEKSVISTLLHR